jgi:hypothetical protein
MKINTEFVISWFRSIDTRVLPFALLTGLLLGVVALSFIAVFRAKALVRDAERRTQACSEQFQMELAALRENQKAFETELREFRQHPPVSMIPSTPRPGLNLTKRSQALRMHRLGDPPERIAAALEIPTQQVDLLLKVHRIVISNV